MTCERPFTLIIPYYENPQMFSRQWGHLIAFRAAVRQKLHVIFCDDGSPDRPLESELEALSKDQFASLQIFRVDVDVRWNWIACRNIGVHHAKTSWVLMTDIDHLLPEATARRIIEGKLRDDTVYRFARVDAPDMTPTIGKHGEHKPHPNTWLMTKPMFDKVGGYDERFSGFYGTDGEFRDRVRGAAGKDKIVVLPEPMIRVPREVVADAATTRYDRKTQMDHDGVTRIRAKIARERGRPHRLTFPYHRVV
jgi:hypothetical protein